MILLIFYLLHTFNGLSVLNDPDIDKFLELNLFFAEIRDGFSIAYINDAASYIEVSITGV